MPPERPDADRHADDPGEDAWFERLWAGYLRDAGGADRPHAGLSVADHPGGHPRFYSADDDEAWPPEMVAIEVAVDRETVDRGRLPIRLVIERRGHGVDPAVVEYVVDRMVEYVKGKPVQYLDINVNSVRGPMDVDSSRVAIAEVTYRFDRGDEGALLEALARGLDEFAELYGIANTTRR